MSLQGTLETIPLPDVLALLAATKKSGELRITGARGDGRLWLDVGKVVAADVPRATTPVDAVFELLRLSAGTFVFAAGSPPGSPGEPIAVDTLLVEAQERLSVWLSIEAVVPSMACTLRLTPELAGDNVTVSRRQWKELVAVAGGGDVNGAMKSLGIGEFDACRTVKELVDAGLVQVGKVPTAPVEAPEQRRPASPTPAPRNERATAPEAPTPPPPARRPAPAPASVPGPVPARAAATGLATPPAPGRAPVTAAPAAAANGGRSAAPRRAHESGPAGEEREELVQQLATLGKAHAKAPAARADATSPEKHDEEGSAEENGDEPINRGMLLKFLSSVRP